MYFHDLFIYFISSHSFWCDKKLYKAVSFPSFVFLNKKKWKTNFFVTIRKDKQTFTYLSTVVVPQDADLVVLVLEHLGKYTFKNL